MTDQTEFAGLLAARQQQIVDLWTERTLDSYAEPGFFKQVRDPFANPVGSLVRSALLRLFELLRTGAELGALARSVDQVVRIRAVQEFTASQAVVPFLELKWVVKEVLAEEALRPALLAQINEFDCAVERMALLAFDQYTLCREQLYRNRVRELQSGRALFTDGGCPSRLLDAAPPQKGGGEHEKVPCPDCKAADGQADLQLFNRYVKE